MQSLTTIRRAVLWPGGWLQKSDPNPQWSETLLQFRSPGTNRWSIPEFDTPNTAAYLCLGYSYIDNQLHMLSDGNSINTGPYYSWIP